MMRLLTFLATLFIAGCGLRVGTDPQGVSAESGTTVVVATWSKDSADSTWTTRRDTLTLDSLRASAIPLEESTFLALRTLDGRQGAWLDRDSRYASLRDAGRLVVRWRDSRHRPSLAFALPGTGTEIQLDSADVWRETSLSVFADRWPARIVHSFQGRRVVWHLDSLPLRDTLRLDLSALPDSSCPIRLGADPSLWECRPR